MSDRTTLFGSLGVLAVGLGLVLTTAPASPVSTAHAASEQPSPRADVALAVARALSNKGPRCEVAGIGPRLAGSSCQLQTRLDEVTTMEVALAKGITPEGAIEAFASQLRAEGFLERRKPAGEIVFQQGQRWVLVTATAGDDGALLTAITTSHRGGA